MCRFSEMLQGLQGVRLYLYGPVWVLFMDGFCCLLGIFCTRKGWKPRSTRGWHEWQGQRVRNDVRCLQLASVWPIRPNKWSSENPADLEGDAIRPTIHIPSIYLITCPICSMDSFQICDEANTPAYELVCLRAHICWNPWMPFIWREAERICQLSQRCGECWKMKFRRHVVLVLAMPLSFLPSMPLLKLLQKTVRPFWLAMTDLAPLFRRVFFGPRLLSLSWQKLRSAEVALTVFELQVVTALLFFARQQVDVAIIEVGMGGRCTCRTSPRTYNTKLNPTWLFHS